MPRELKLNQRIGYCLTLLVVGAILCCHASAAQVSKRLLLELKPAQKQIIPNSDPVTFSLQRLNPPNAEPSDATFKVTLKTPSKIPGWTSDFPWVEETTLLQFDTVATDGKLTFSQTLPIRGRYQLYADIKPIRPGQFLPFTQGWAVDVPENPVKYRNALILLGILLLLGLGSGWVIGGKQRIQPGEVAPQAVRLWISGAIVAVIAALLYVNITGEMSHSHGPSSSPLTSSSKNQASAGQIMATLLGETNAVVGQTVAQTIKVEDTLTHKPISDILLKITTIALEDQSVVFEYQGKPNLKGYWTWRQQFFDGSPHQVVAQIAPLSKAQPSFKPFEVSQVVEVEGLAPPLATRLISLCYYMLIFVLGMGLGFRLRKRYSSQLELSLNQKSIVP